MVYAYSRIETLDTIIAYAARTPQGHLILGVYSLLVSNSAKTLLDDNVCSIEAPPRQPSHLAILATHGKAARVVLYKPPSLLYEPGRGRQG